MSNVDIKQVSSATGTFPALRIKADEAARGGRVEPETGKVTPEAGKEAPVAAEEQVDLEAIAAELNIASQSIGRDLRFKVDMNSGSSVIQVLDRDTGEIIREIPPDKAKLSVSSNGNMQLRLYDGLA